MSVSNILSGEATLEVATPNALQTSTGTQASDLMAGLVDSFRLCVRVTCSHYAAQPEELGYICCKVTLLSCYLVKM